MGGLRAPSHQAQILPHLSRPQGRFVEIGARDGGKTSFTLYLEKALGWKGVLIEPWPHLFRKCRKIRKGSLVLNVAVVDERLQDSYIEVRGAPPKTSISRVIQREAIERIEGRPLGVPLAPPSKERISYVTTDTARNILQKASVAQNFELLVLNLPGNEEQVLQGMDFTVYRPQFILAKLGLKDRALSYLPSTYQLVASSPHDQRSMLRLYRNNEYEAN